MHEYSHKVGMVHDERLTLEAAKAHVESRRAAVLSMPPWISGRDVELEKNINDTYFLELLFLESW